MRSFIYRNYAQDCAWTRVVSHLACGLLSLEDKDDRPKIYPSVDRDEWGIRGKIRFEPNADFDAMLTVDHIQRAATCCGTTGVAYVPGGQGRAERQGWPVGEENDLGYFPDQSPSNTNYDTVALEMNLFTGNGGTITSLTGYQSSINDSDFRSYNTGNLTFFIDNDGLTDMEQFTQELRYTSLEGEFVEYVAGLYYYFREFDRFLDQQLDIGAFIGRGERVFGLAQSRFVNSTSTSYAGFANLTFNLTDSFRVSTGGRLQYDEADVFGINEAAFDGTFLAPFAPNQGERAAERDDTALSWRVALEYDVNPDALIYASVVRGYKSLGVNGLGTLITAEQPIVDPEIPTAYELGWKTELLDRAVRLNGSIFRTTFKDFQAQAIVLNPATQIGEFFLASAGELRTQGVEVQLDAEPVVGFTLSGGVSYIDAEYTDFPGAPCYDSQTAAEGCIGGSQDLTGEPLVGVSDWNVTANARYEVPIDPLELDVYALATYTYRTDFNTTTDPLTEVDGYGTVDAFLGLITQDGLGVQVFVKNLFDDFYSIGRTTAGRNQSGYNLQQSLAYDYKRRFGVSLSYRY